ncbi:MAG: dihydroorotate dehydrogenase [Dehalococcoidales bacterium]|nr:dihydroorotate dehydrogenase [Dehalococcoidales bacterium]
MNLSVQLAPKNKRGLKLKNPVMTASGTFGYGMEYEHLFDIQKLGVIVCKGTTLEPREGNPQPRIVETAGGMLNSIGLQNVGLDVLIKEKAPVWAKWEVPVIVNIAGKTVDDYARLAAGLDGVAGVSGIEVNISCPNVSAGGAEFGADPASAAKVTEAVRKATSLPVIVKLTPNTAEIIGIAKAVAAAGADALCLINTVKAMAIDVKTQKPILGNGYGGLSGPAIKPVALQMVYSVFKNVKVPIIGCGGIANGHDAVEFIMAGATAVQVGTASFMNPRAPMDVLEGIEKFLREENIKDVRELIGVAQR